MTEEGFTEVEAALGWPLPPRYREFLLKFPAPLFHPEAQNGTDYRSQDADRLLFHTPRSIIRYNRSRRLPGGLWVIADGAPAPWPDDFLIIGDNGGGDAYCINRHDPRAMVYLHDHETGVFRALNRTLEEYALDLIDSIARRKCSPFPRNR